MRGAGAFSGKTKPSGIRFALLAVAASILANCSEPPPKPVPPLDPSKVPAAQKKETPPPAAAANPVEKGSVTRMPLGELFQLVQSNAALIYDVRPAFLYAVGHVPGAISWPKNNLAKNLTANETRIRAANSAHTPVVIYCSDLSCPDAVTVATALAERGHKVSVLQGGYEAWKIANE